MAFQGLKLGMLLVIGQAFSMKAYLKIKTYAESNGLSVDDLKAMGKRAVVEAAGLTRAEARTVSKSIDKIKRKLEKQALDDKLDNVQTHLRAGTLPARPAAVVKWLEPGVSYKVTLDG